MSSPNYSQLLSFSYGAAQLDLLSFAVKEDAVVKPGIGRTATNVEVDCECRIIQTDTTGDYQAAIAAVLPDLHSDGRDLLITEIGGETMYALLAANCMDGGPHISFQMMDGEGPLQKLFRLKITAPTFDPTKGVLNSYKVRTATRPDGLRTVTWSGELVGVSSADYYLSTILINAKKQFALPGWVLDHTYESSQDSNGSKTTYTITSRQNFNVLPKVDANTLAVDGELTVQKNRDEQQRLTTTTRADFWLIGDPDAMLTKLRKQAAGKDNTPIYRESSEVTTIERVTLKAEFVTITSADRSPMLDWTETVTLEGADAWERKTYPGADPIVVRKPTTFPTVTQSGTCTAVNAYKKTTSLFASYLETPQITFVDVDGVLKRTTWRYVMYPSGAGSVPTANYDVFAFDPSFMARAKQDNNYFAGGK